MTEQHRGLPSVAHATAHSGASAAAHDTAALSAFADSLFGHLPRADQRRWAQAYLQGLLSTPGKKSIRRLAAAVSSSPTASQSLQQFINASPWDWSPARVELIRELEQRTVPRAWTIGTAVLPKRGDHSCGVHRRFVPELGRTINCQLGIGVFLASGEQHLPVDWRLMLPDQWNDDPRLRDRAKVPDDARHRPLWAHALDLATSLAARTSLGPVPVVADLSEYADAVALVDGLTRQGRDFVLAVSPATRVLPAGPRPAGPHRAAPGGPAPLGARQFLHRHSTRHPHTVAVTAPGRAQRQIRVLSGLVRLPGSPHTYRMFTETRPARIWLTTLVDLRVDRLTALAGLHSGTSATMADLERDYGLLDFEGRSFPGWHHHMTLVSAAYAYSRLYAPEAVLSRAA